MEVLLDVHGEGVQELQRGDEFAARQDEAIVSPALEGLEHWETDPAGTCGVAVSSHVADAVADERHGGAPGRRQHDLPHFPRFDFLPLRVDEFHPHVVRKDVVVVVPALGGDHPGLFRGVFVVDGTVEGFGDEGSLILCRELRVDPDKFGPDMLQVVGSDASGDLIHQGGVTDDEVGPGFPKLGDLLFDGDSRLDMDGLEERPYAMIGAVWCI